MPGTIRGGGVGVGGAGVGTTCCGTTVIGLPVSLERASLAQSLKGVSQPK